MKRQYKTDTPFNTITRIRSILKILDCPVFEVMWANPHDSIYSTRVETGFENGRFGTNGKGQNRLFCLASAYAEFIERLQNGLVIAACSIPRLFLNKLKEKTGFYYFPDEKMISKEEFDKLPESILSDFFNENKIMDTSEQLYNRLKQNGYTGCLSVPFYNVRENREVYIPYNLLLELTGSNGMAAGNSPAEAVFQGLCELFERYAAFRVFNEQLTPPTIPMEFIEEYQSETAIIHSIESDGNYRVIVKDFSTDEKLPVIGVIVVDVYRNYYKLNVGSDSCFQVALGRCLTEIYQGREKETFYNDMLPIPEKELPFFKKDDTESIRQKTDEFIKFTTNGSGMFPKSLFGEKESYQFDMSTFDPQNNYEKENEKFIEKLIRLGYEIFIRDVSFLGFPSYLIYVPTISQMGKKEINHGGSLNMEEMIDTDKIEDLFFPFTECKGEKLEELARIIERNHITDTKMKDILKLEFNGDSPWYSLPTTFFLTLLWYQHGNVDKSIENLTLFISQAENIEVPYYECTLDYLKFKKIHADDTARIYNEMSGKGHDAETTEEIIESFSDPSQLFRYIHVPNCPDCDLCNLNNECLTRNKISFTERINRELSKSALQQKNVRASY